MTVHVHETEEGLYRILTLPVRQSPEGRLTSMAADEVEMMGQAEPVDVVLIDPSRKALLTALMMSP